MLTRKFLVLTFVVVAADFTFGGVYVQVLLDRGLSTGFIGTTLFGVLIASSFIEIPSGDWGDRFGQRRLTILGLLSWGIGLVAFGLTDFVPITVLALLLWSVGQALYSGAPISLAINSIPTEDGDARQRLVKAANVTKWIGSTAGGLLVLFGALQFNVEVAIVVAGAGMLLVALWVRLAWPESERVEVDPSAGMFSRLRRNWSPQLWPLLLLFVVTSALLSLLLFAWQPLAVSVIHLPESFLGLALVVLTAVAAAGAAATRFESERLAKHNVDIWVLLALSGGFLAVADLSPWLAGAAILVSEFTISAALTLGASRAHAIFRDDSRNLLWSAFGWSSSIAMALADLLLGWTWDDHALWLGLSSSVVVLAIAVAVVVVVASLRRVAAKQTDAERNVGP
ncbi:MFS transporter [Gryllotalpicola sp.]|uniref:MFS transporter n=1 Tax=Gryllotalpicola sp. TaxID=1932787 RepID=UPI00260888C6|nr:MFS transporter [Gryllotalpicola sp.]